MEDFATLEDLEKFWRTIDSSDSERANTMLHMASIYLRQIAKNNNVDLDTLATSDTSGVYMESIKLIVLESVKRALLRPNDAPPADEWTQSANPYSESMRFTNPSSDLYFKSKELKLLGLASISGHSQFGLLRGVRG